MIAALAEFIDWYALQAAAMLPSIRKCARGDSKLTEPIEFLNGPDFIPPKSRPAELEFTSKIHFIFPSPFAQAVDEIRALTEWLLKEGCPAVALWGISYGGRCSGVSGVVVE